MPRMTLKTLAVLNAVIAKPMISGYEIKRRTGLFTGTLYPILVRLEDAGWLESEWEEGDPRILQRPRRRYYSATALGRRAVESA